MAPQYSKDTLRRLRNDISINLVIEQLLQLPVKHTDGLYRFLCPLCGEFTTGVKTETNLGRCFRCERNFNPIDLVIESMGISFLDAAGLLLPILKSKQGALNKERAHSGACKSPSGMPQRAGELLSALAIAAQRQPQSQHLRFWEGKSRKVLLD